MSDDGRQPDLAPPAMTHEDDLCSCQEPTAIKLMTALSYHPIRCVKCNREVPLSCLPFTTELVRSIAHWRWIYDAIYRLWLDSEDYESWALAELASISSRVNQLGLQLRSEINPRRKCYYWLFQDKTEDEYKPLTSCPVCSKDFSEHHGDGFTQLACEGCGILLPGSHLG